MVAMPWNDTGSMITHFEDLIKRVYVSPDLPQGPTFHNFPYSPTSNPNELNAIKTAFLNAFELALAGLRVATTPCQGDEDMPSAYTRYFNAGEDVRQTVVNVLMGMLGPGNMGPDMMHDAQWPLEVWYDAIGGGRYAFWRDDDCQKMAHLMARLVWGKIDGGLDLSLGVIVGSLSKTERN